MFKPQYWPVERGRIDQKYRDIFDSAVCILPMWEHVGHTAFDISGHGHHGNLVDNGGLVSWLTSTQGPALDFGSEFNHAYVDLPYSDLHSLPVSNAVKPRAIGSSRNNNPAGSRAFSRTLRTAEDW